MAATIGTWGQTCGLSLFGGYVIFSAGVKSGCKAQAQIPAASCALNPIVRRGLDRLHDLSPQNHGPILSCTVLLHSYMLSMSWVDLGRKTHTPDPETALRIKSVIRTSPVDECLHSVRPEAPEPRDPKDTSAQTR